MDNPSSAQPPEVQDSSSGILSARTLREEKDNSLPDVALKWGRTPKKPTEEEKSKWENYYSEEEKAKLRAEGINPALKAEMENNKRKHGGGFWSKVAQTSFGGGWTK